MNAPRTHQNAQHATNAGKGRHRYQPAAASSCRACNRLVYKTQTLDWDLDRVAYRVRRPPDRADGVPEPDRSEYSLPYEFDSERSLT